MKSRAPIFVATFCAAMLAACGNGGGRASDSVTARPGLVNRTGAQAVIDQTRAMRTALLNGDGASLYAAATAVGLTGAPQIVTPPPMAAILSPVRSAVVVAGPGGGSVDCDTTGCVYSQYRTAGQTVSGAVTASTVNGLTTVATDLTIVVAATATNSQSITWVLAGRFDFSATTIDGRLESNAHIEVGDPKLVEDNFSVVAESALQLDDSGVAIGGSVYAKWGIAVQDYPDASQAWEGTVTYP